MFLFSLVPKAKKYVWTKNNDYFMLVGDKSISFGGGYFFFLKISLNFFKNQFRKGTGLWLDDGKKFKSFRNKFNFFLQNWTKDIVKNVKLLIMNH